MGLNYILVFLIIMVASMIQGATSFGFAIMAVPLLTLLLPLRSVVVIVGILAFITAFQLAFKLREHIDIRIILIPVVFSILARILGVVILMNADITFLKVFLGIFLVLLAVYFLIFSKRIVIKTSTRNGIIAGSLSGITGGLFNMSGPPMVVYYLSSIKDKMKYAASTQVTFAIGCVISIIMHALYGNINSGILLYSAAGVIASTIGCYLGLKIFRMINRENLNRIIYLFLVVMGVMTIIRG